ncbi:MAG: UvrD-helicase domain-containing protein [Clostridiaceae bacterium]|nr:UvrD-helicase domain-containing protein [Clostridiaceae bacterium]
MLQENIQNLIKDLNPQQQEAVLHEDGPLLILAGAGSGKTRVITYRIAYLIEARNVWPGQIMAITFTNKAATEMRERTEQLIGFKARGMWIGTFHSMMLRILRQHAERIGFQPNFTIMDTDDQQRLIKEILKELKVDENFINAKTAHNKISSAKNKRIDWQMMEKSAGNNYFQKQIAEIYKRYQEMMLRANSMDFDDILLFAVKLLEENLDVRAAYQTRFKHILVDEYQDTNHVQYLLVKLLGQKHRNICVVGDDDQSIYSFRGANIQNILNFEKDYKESKVIKLEQNYRSSKNILGAANAIIKENEGRTDKRLWTNQNNGEPIQFYLAESHYDEARYVASEIKRLTNRNNNPIKAGEIGILYRVNALSRNLEFALREQGINYNIYGGLRFYDRKEIRDFLAYMRVVFSENDELALMRIINVPKRGIGNKTVETISTLAGKENVSMMQIVVNADQYPELSRASARLTEFANLIAGLRQILIDDKITFPDFSREILAQSGLLAELQEKEKKGEEDAYTRIENLQEIISDTIEFEEKIKQEIEQIKSMETNLFDLDVPDLSKDDQDIYSEDLSLTSLTKNFLEQTALYSDLDQEDAENTVRLMAVHSAKGLEFDAVFLIGMEESIFPSYRSFDDPEQLEEERRLAYVAVTRARKYLHITAANMRLLYGQTKYNPISRFLSEIPDEFIREVGGSRLSQQNRTNRFGGRTYESTQASSNYGSNHKFHRASSIPNSSSYSQNSPGKKSKVLGSFGLSSKPTKSLKQDNGIVVSQLREGQQFSHKKFGLGVLEKIDYVSKDAILSIKFDSGLKRMMASSAPIKAVKD